MLPSKGSLHLLSRVVEVDPLECPRCGRKMKMIALIDDSEVIEKILRHLGLWVRDALPLRAPPEPIIRGYIHEPFFEDLPVLIAEH